MHQLRSQRWQQLLGQIDTEYRGLSDSEKSWIAERLQQIERLQQQLNRDE